MSHTSAAPEIQLTVGTAVGQKEILCDALLVSQSKMGMQAQQHTGELLLHGILRPRLQESGQYWDHQSMYSLDLLPEVFAVREGDGISGRLTSFRWLWICHSTGSWDVASMGERQLVADLAYIYIYIYIFIYLFTYRHIGYR